MAKQRNREQIQQLKKENKELREQLKQRALSAGTTNTESTKSYLAKSEKDLALWRRKMDRCKAITIKLKNELLSLQDKLGEISSEQIDMNSDDNP